MEEAAVRNARIRDEGTRNLIAVAVAAGVRRMVVQSIAFAYAPGPTPYDENAPLNLSAPGRGGSSARGVANLERQVLAAPLEGVVLRYGHFYGPGTGFDTPRAGGSLHVEAAADAARRAATRGAKGIYNVAESDGTVSTARAIADLGWSADFRIET
jgi:nucleoside-diphosphate-sugar epimerase